MSAGPSTACMCWASVTATWFCGHDVQNHQMLLKDVGSDIRPCPLDWIIHRLSKIRAHHECRCSAGSTSVLGWLQRRWPEGLLLRPAWTACTSSSLSERGLLQSLLPWSTALSSPPWRYCCPRSLLGPCSGFVIEQDQQDPLKGNDCMQKGMYLNHPHMFISLPSLLHAPPLDIQ